MNEPADLGKAHLRIVRPSDDLAGNVKFYRDGLGFEVLYEFRDHDGFDAVMLGRKEAAYHLAFVHKVGHKAALGRPVACTASLMIQAILVGCGYGPRITSSPSAQPIRMAVEGRPTIPVQADKVLNSRPGGARHRSPKPDPGALRASWGIPSAR